MTFFDGMKDRMTGLGSGMLEKVSDWLGEGSYPVKALKCAVVGTSIIAASTCFLFISANPSLLTGSAGHLSLAKASSNIVNGFANPDITQLPMLLLPTAGVAVGVSVVILGLTNGKGIPKPVAQTIAMVSLAASAYFMYRSGVYSGAFSTAFTLAAPTTRNAVLLASLMFLPLAEGFP